MGLVVVACPQSESELSVMQCALGARGVHFFVQGGGFGSLWPGPQIPAYNARRIMVPGAEVPAAKEALAPLMRPQPDVQYRWPGLLGILRMIAEFSLFGWFVPGKQRRKDDHTSRGHSDRPG